MVSLPSSFAPALAAVSSRPGCRVAVVGSRGFSPLGLVSSFVAALPASCVVISGAAAGVDRTAASAARQAGLVLEEFPADWNQHGKAAGMIRNREIVSRCDVLVAFWDGSSRGTAASVALARSAGLPCFVVAPPAAAGGSAPAQLSLF